MYDRDPFKSFQLPVGVVKRFDRGTYIGYRYQIDDVYFEANILDVLCERLREAGYDELRIASVAEACRRLDSE